MSVSSLFLVVLVGAVTALGAQPKADHREPTLAIVMTNDPSANAVQVYDANTHVLLQTLSTHGKGGVGGNARGVRQSGGELFAAVNNGSNTVAVFRRERGGLVFQQLVTTTSAPVSIDFRNDHMYVAGVTTVDSFRMRHNDLEFMDGSTVLELAEGVPPAGTTAQVGVVDERRLLVTLKTDPTPGTVDVVALRGGAISPDAPDAVAAPAGSLTPFGFSIYPDADLDSDGGVLGVVDHSGGQSHLTLFATNAFGELTLNGTAITVGVPNANGVAIMAPQPELGSSFR